MTSGEEEEGDDVDVGMGLEYVFMGFRVCVYGF